jgi:hypothetical protein
MGLGRTTRFAPLPAGARRVSVMRRGGRGLAVLGPSEGLLRDFQAEKRALERAGRTAAVAHAEASRRVGYRDRYLREIRGSAAAMAALGDVVARARQGDLYLMCMCPYRTRGRACHTYLLLDLARELDPALRLLPEPAPKSRSSP